MAILVMCVEALPQTATVKSTLGGDSIKVSGEESSHSFYSGLGYGSNMIYLGSTISQNNPYYYTALTYGFKDELYVTASAIHLYDRSPFIPQYSISLNYSYVINSWFDFALGLYRYQVTQSLADSLFGSFTYGEATYGVDWRLLYTKISFGGIFAKEGGAYLQVRNSRYFETPEFFDNRVNVSFDPYINLLFGTLVTSETSAGQSIPENSHPKPPWSHGNGNSGSTITTSYNKKFDAMELDLGLPVTLNSERFTVEAETYFVLPLYTDPDYPDIKGFVFLLSVYYRIF